MYCRFEEYRHIRLNRNRTRKNSLILYSICYFFPFRSFVQIYLSQRVCFYVPAFVLGTDYRMELTRVKQTRHMCVQPFVNIRIFKTMRVYFSTCLCSSSSSSSCSLLAKKKKNKYLLHSFIQVNIFFQLLSFILFLFYLWFYLIDLSSCWKIVYHSNIHAHSIHSHIHNSHTRKRKKSAKNKRSQNEKSKWKHVQHTKPNGNKARTTTKKILLFVWIVSSPLSDTKHKFNLTRKRETTSKKCAETKDTKTTKNKHFLTEITTFFVVCLLLLGSCSWLFNSLLILIHCTYEW